MDPIDDMAQPFTDHSHHAFAKTFAAAFIGAMIGSMIDNTRFGYWFNTSKVVGFVFTLIKLAILALVLFYIYCVIKVW